MILTSLSFTSLLIAGTSAIDSRGSAGHPGWPYPGPGGCKQIQYNFPPGTNAGDHRAEAIKQAYLQAWNEYDQNCFGYDDIDPLPKTTCLYDFYGWGLTIVDGLDTAIIMGLTEVVDKMLAHIATVDFSTSPDLVDEFDTVIRYIGGLLSGYDLITSGLAPHAETYNREHVKLLLVGAKTLGNLLRPVFDSPSGLPHFLINTTTHKPQDGGLFPYPFPDPLNNKTYYNVTNTAIAGTIVLEFGRLSDLTGDESFRELANRAEQHLINPQPPPVYPGLVGLELNLNTGEFLTFDAGWYSGIDSFYEYLIKSYIYDPRKPYVEEYKDFWVTAVDSTERELAQHPYGFPEITFITGLNASGAKRYWMDDYSCFAGGNFLLGGAYLGRQDYIDLGIAVTDGCHRTFNETSAGLNPNSFVWYGPDNKLGAGSESLGNPVTKAFYKKAGFIVDDPENLLFPEPIESMLYAYRITGNTIWQDYAWKVFQAQQKDAHRGGAAVTCLYNVSQPLGGAQFNYLPSYYFAEVMKYLYLLFSPPDLVSLDQFVFNTECHPLRIQSGTCGAAGLGPY